MTDINEILASLTAAKAAQDRVPVLEQINSELSTTVICLEETKSAHERRIDALSSALAEALASIKAKEEALASATFRETETRTKLETLRSLVGGALEEVKEKAEAVVEAVEAAEGQSVDPLPNVDGTDNPQGIASLDGVEPITDAPTPITNIPRPYAFRRSWQKPSHLTWGEWRQGGGEAESWMADSDH